MFCGTLVGNHWSVGRFVLSCLVQEVILSQCMNYCKQHFGIPFSVYVIMAHVTYKYQYSKYKKIVLCGAFGNTEVGQLGRFRLQTVLNSQEV
jgi:hypothetical protein